ncbi:hypothetical protein MKQ70_27660 [Chitinophaga sedimenti]|uniref:hypothetical protein n=1 Tax=Chitinophaga sedimenti TaxID=2033606 RepID=UPI002005B04C|nr:hypothetical protein [Chitinophaga sedimenti]MCK7558568.1 hypothetical protein [Chitinophaga sedimenti]
MAGYLRDYLLPLSKNYEIEFDNGLLAEVDDIMPDCRVYLKEVGEPLSFSLHLLTMVMM